MGTKEFFIEHPTTTAIALHMSLQIKFYLSVLIPPYGLQKPNEAMLHSLIL